MAGAALTITVDDAEVRRALGELIGKLHNPRDALAEIGEVLTASTQRRFATQTAPDGSAWARNTETTRARKRNPNVLTEGGYLGDTIHPVVFKDQVAIGSNLVYAAAQQFGNPDNRFYNTPRGAAAPIPPRPFPGLSDEDRARVLEILRDYLAQT